MGHAESGYRGRIAGSEIVLESMVGETGETSLSRGIWRAVHDRPGGQRGRQVFLVRAILKQPGRDRMREVGPDVHLWCRRGKGRAKLKVCDREDQDLRFGHGEMGLREQKRRSPMRKDVISFAVSSCSGPRLISLTSRINRLPIHQACPIHHIVISYQQAVF